jgi:hypothetical protein
MLRTIGPRSEKLLQGQKKNLSLTARDRLDAAALGPNRRQLGSRSEKSYQLWPQLVAVRELHQTFHELGARTGNLRPRCRGGSSRGGSTAVARGDARHGQIALAPLRGVRSRRTRISRGSLDCAPRNMGVRRRDKMIQAGGAGVEESHFVRCGRTKWDCAWSLVFCRKLLMSSRSYLLKSTNMPGKPEEPPAKPGAACPTRHRYQARIPTACAHQLLPKWRLVSEPQAG